MCKIIYEYRKKNWIKQKELAENINKECKKLGVKTNFTKQNISYWEKSKCLPRDKVTVQAIAKVIGVSESELIAEFNKSAESK